MRIVVEPAAPVNHRHERLVIDGVEFPHPTANGPWQRWWGLQWFPGYPRRGDFMNALAAVRGIAPSPEEDFSGKRLGVLRERITSRFGFTPGKVSTRRALEYYRWEQKDSA